MNANEKFIAAEAHVDAAAIAPLPNSKKTYVIGSRPDVRVPMRELGYAAAQQILARIGGTDSARVTELAVDLIVRGTTAPPRR